jgi:hypothetical protein
VGFERAGQDVVQPGDGEAEGISAESVDGAGEAAATDSIEDVGVDHRGLDIAVAEELLDGADIGATGEKMGREGVAKGMAGGVLGDTCSADRGVHCALNDGGMEVVAQDLAGPRVRIE